MKTQTLEMIIEELATALQTERWVNKSQREKIAELEEEIGVLKKLLDNRCDACGKSVIKESDSRAEL